jgi:hypothetical protein
MDPNHDPMVEVMITPRCSGSDFSSREARNLAVFLVVPYGTDYSEWIFFNQQVLKLGANEASDRGLQNAI